MRAAAFSCGPLCLWLMEMKQFLSPRLRSVAAFVTNGARVADVGTDHGYLPVWLIQNGICSEAIAVDIRPGPLSHARRTALEWELQEKIRFVLSDGLEAIEPSSVDTVVMAGMGGETIVDILARAPWTLRQSTHLILQPQSKLDVLADWLYAAGYAVLDASLVTDAGRIYLVLSVQAGAGRTPYTDAQMLINRILMERRDPLLAAYLDLEMRRLQKSIHGLQQAAAPDLQRLSCQQKTYRDYMAMKKEMESWHR